MIDTVAQNINFEELTERDRELLLSAIKDLPDADRSHAEALVLGGISKVKEHIVESENQAVTKSHSETPAPSDNRTAPKSEPEPYIPTRDKRHSDAMGQYLRDIGKHELLTHEQVIELSKTVQSGLKAKEELIEAAASTNAETLQHLRQRERDGDKAKMELIQCNLRLVVTIAKRYPLPPGMELLDLIQEGNLGLEHAVEKFDWRKGFKFSTYATIWIRQAIGRAIDQKGNLVRLPGEKAGRLRATLREVLGDGDEITDEKMAELFRLATPTSIHRTVGDGNDGEFGDFLPDNSENPEDAVTEQMEYEAIMELLKHLDPRPKLAVEYRVGIEDGRKHSFREVGERLGITAEAARRLTQRAFKDLKYEAGKAGLTDR